MRMTPLLLQANVCAWTQASVLMVNAREHIHNLKTCPKYILVPKKVPYNFETLQQARLKSPTVVIFEDTEHIVVDSLTKSPRRIR